MLGRDDSGNYVIAGTSGEPLDTTGEALRFITHRNLEEEGMGWAQWDLVSLEVPDLAPRAPITEIGESEAQLRNAWLDFIALRYRSRLRLIDNEEVG